MIEEKDIEQLAPMLENAGLPKERHREFIDVVNSFTTMMSVLLQANEDGAPNFITFSLATPENVKYELTVRRSEGKTPGEVIAEKDAEIAANGVICGNHNIEVCGGGCWVCATLGSHPDREKLLSALQTEIKKANGDISALCSEKERLKERCRTLEHRLTKRSGIRVDEPGVRICNQCRARVENLNQHRRGDVLLLLCDECSAKMPW